MRYNDVELWMYSFQFSEPLLYTSYRDYLLIYQCIAFSLAGPSF